MREIHEPNLVGSPSGEVTRTPKSLRLAGRPPGPLSRIDRCLTRPLTQRVSAEADSLTDSNHRPAERQVCILRPGFEHEPHGPLT